MFSGVVERDQRKKIVWKDQRLIQNKNLPGDITRNSDQTEKYVYIII